MGYFAFLALCMIFIPAAAVFLLGLSLPFMLVLALPVLGVMALANLLVGGNK